MQGTFSLGQPVVLGSAGVLGQRILKVDHSVVVGIALCAHLIEFNIATVVRVEVSKCFEHLVDFRL